MALHDKFNIISEFDSNNETIDASQINNFIENYLESETYIIHPDYIHQLVWHNKISDCDKLIDTVTEQLTQVSEKILEQNQQRSVTEQEKLSNIQGELVKLIETVKTYQDSFNSESKQLGNQLINRLDERLSQTSDKIEDVSNVIESIIIKYA